MHGLITDLLDVARIDAGTLAVSPEPMLRSWWTGPRTPS